MKRLIMGMVLLHSILLAQGVEYNLSYDYFRGIPDGSWNGNSGAKISVNGASSLYDCFGVQLGGSYGNYNWDGRENLVFNNPKAVQQIGFITAGVFNSYDAYNAAVLYDQMFTKHFGIYDTDPTINQIRFQGGYACGTEEVGFWGTVALSTSHKKAFGVPIEFKAINQINLFWTHAFSKCSKSSVWVGVPYADSLIYSNKTAGQFIVGFSLKAPLTNCLILEGNGSYMRARHAKDEGCSRNYAANVCIGITYLFSGGCFGDREPYMPLANHSNFLVDTNSNL